MYRGPRLPCLLVLLVLCACGASAAEIARAKAATYRGNGDEMFAIVEQVAAQDYKIADAHEVAPDEATEHADIAFFDKELITEPQWYSPEGGRESVGAGNFVTLTDRSVQLSLIVRLAENENRQLVVTITPKTFQHIEGSPKPRELAPDDPNLPPWIPGRVESLYLAIHHALEKYEAK